MYALLGPEQIPEARLSLPPTYFKLPKATKELEYIILHAFIVAAYMDINILDSSLDLITKVRTCVNLRALNTKSEVNLISSKLTELSIQTLD